MHHPACRKMPNSDPVNETHRTRSRFGVVVATCFVPCTLLYSSQHCMTDPAFPVASLYPALIACTYMQLNIMEGTCSNSPYMPLKRQAFSYHTNVKSQTTWTLPLSCIGGMSSSQVLSALKCVELSLPAKLDCHSHTCTFMAVMLGCCTARRAVWWSLITYMHIAA